MSKTKLKTKRLLKSDLIKKVRRAAKEMHKTLATLENLPPIMTSMPEPVKAEVKFNVPGMKQAFLAELNRRARFKGKRGERYRALLLAMVPSDGKKETIN